MDLLKEKLRQNIITDAEYKEQKKDVTYFGFDSERKFWYAIGKPLTILFFALYIYVTSKYIVDKSIKKITIYTSFVGMSIGFYFVVWAFWYRDELNVHIYYTAMSIVAITLALISIKLISSFYRVRKQDLIKSKRFIEEARETLSLLKQQSKSLINN